MFDAEMVRKYKAEVKGLPDHLPAPPADLPHVAVGRRAGRDLRPVREPVSGEDL